MIGLETIKTMLRPISIFVILMVGVTAILQHTLILFKLAGAYTHWAVILLILPILIGLLLRRGDEGEPMIIVIAGALISTIALYLLYKNYFWAQAPSFLNSLFFFAVIAGCSHMPFSQAPVTRFLERIEQFKKNRKKARRANKSKKGPVSKTKNNRSKNEPSLLKTIFANENTIPMIEMSVGIVSLLLSVYSIVFMGQS